MNAVGPEWGGWPAKHVPRALLGYVMESLLSASAGGGVVGVPSPWDAWWVCYRAALPLDNLAVRVVLRDQACEECSRDALTLARQASPGHPGDEMARRCGCLRGWARRMRAPAAPVTWPPLPLTLALIKPGAPDACIRRLLHPDYDVLWSVRRSLSALDTRRLYPEAYGAGYVAARDAYMTSGPVTVLVLRTRHPQAIPGGLIKDQIRRETGADDVRNHLHMPDNPGEALADIAHLAGATTLADLYERHERDRARSRLAFYRAALGVTGPGAHRRAS